MPNVFEADAAITITNGYHSNVFFIDNNLFVNLSPGVVVIQSSNKYVKPIKQNDQNIVAGVTLLIQLLKNALNIWNKAIKWMIL